MHYVEGIDQELNLKSSENSNKLRKILREQERIQSQAEEKYYDPEETTYVNIMLSRRRIEP